MGKETRKTAYIAKAMAFYSEKANPTRILSEEIKLLLFLDKRNNLVQI